MKNLLYLPVLVFINYTSNAQITLTAANSNPVAGDTSHFYSENMNPGDSGVNITWDFSSLNPLHRTTRIFGGADGPAFCHTAGLPLSYWNDMIAICNYVSYDGDSLFATSGYNPIAMGGYTYRDPKLILRYPLSYNGTHYYDSFFYDDAWHSGSIDTNFGLVEMWADGYGTLILPDSTYSNVLRVKKIETGKYLDYEDNFALVERYDYVDEYYEWYSATAQHDALLVIHRRISTTGTNNVMADREGIVVYPNPAHNSLIVKSPADNVTVENIALLDLVGKERLAAENKQKLKSFNVDVSSVPDGLYLLKIQTDEGSTVRRVEIAK